MAAEDFDVEAMLEAPFKKGADDPNVSQETKNQSTNGYMETKLSKRHHSRSRSKEKIRARSRSRHRSRTPKKRSKSPRKSGSRDRKDRSRSRDKKLRSRSRDKKARSRSREKKARSRSRDKKYRSRSRDKKDRSRSKDKKDRSRSRDKKDRSRSRDKKLRSRSRDRKDRSKSRERKDKSRSRERKARSRSRDKKALRSRSRDKKRRSRTKSPRGSRSPKKSRRSRSRDKKARDSSRERIKKRSKSREKRNSPKERRRSKSRERVKVPIRSPSPFSVKPWMRGRSPSKRGLPALPQEDDLTPEERDARTIFCIQLSQRVRARDLEEFFSSVGKVRDVRLITCNKTRRFKGIAYIEFKDPESVPLALGLSGQKLLGIPIVVQHTQAEKNRMGNSMPNLMPKGMTGPMRLYVGSLHFNITENMLRGIFEPFGKIESIQLMMDPETGRSKGYGFITFHNCEDAKKALEQLNGFELAGRPMKVGNVTERLDLQQTNLQTASILDSDELDRSGIDLGATGRLQLMFKLAEGAGLQVPPAAASALSITTPAPVPSAATPPIATQCFMLSNMFEPTEAAAQDPENWHVEIRDDVIEECNKHGGVLHVFVDRTSPQGNVYVKCPTIATAVASVNSLHGRWFAGRIITAAYVPLLNYHSLFPDAMTSLQLLLPTRSSKM